MPTPLAKYLAS